MIEGKSRAEIKQVCRGCSSNLCEGLYLKDIIVSPDFFAVPFDCPMRTDDEYTITRELHRLF